MAFKKVRLPQLCWYANDMVEFRFPSSWDVGVCYMSGHRRPPLAAGRIRDAFSDPIGTRPIRELAEGKKEVVVLFDDMSRPTRAADLVPYVLGELEAAGVRDESVRFIAATGAHGALTRLDFSSKLGEDVLGRFPVYNHNPYENCVSLGNTSLGTPISINREVMSCDLKIGIGCILPHPLTGFGGGGKILMPGVASIDSMHAHHSLLMLQLLTEGKDPGIGIATFEDNLLRRDIAEAAKMAGLDVVVNVVLNGRGNAAGVFVGDPEAAHAEGVRLARDVYATQPIRDPDIIILNAYSKASEAVLAVPLLGSLLQGGKADVVLVANAPEGQVPHYLIRSFGKKVGGRLWSPPSAPPENLRSFTVLTRYIDIAGADWLASPGSIIWARTWDEVLERLTLTHEDRATVAVVPDATMQYFVAG